MTFRPAIRKAWTCAHVVASVGWIGAIVATLALAIVGVASSDARSITGAYLSMETLGRFVLAPFSVATLVTGVVLSLGTRWKLLRHYWVVIKLVISVAAAGILAMYLRTLGHLAEVADAPALGLADRAALGSPTVVLHSTLALVALVVATVLAVYKPRGMTRRGRRAARSDAAAFRDTSPDDRPFT